MTSTYSLSTANSSDYINSESNPLDEALESTSTLVNPDRRLKLVFDRNSVISATLYSRAGPLYRITTNKAVSRTDLCDLTEQRVVATVKRRELFPDAVVFAHRSGKSIRLSKWLKRQKSPPGIQRTTELLTPSGSFTWKSDSTHRFALYSQDQTPIAYSKMLEDPPTLALVLMNCSDSIVQVEIITSFLVLEHKLRMKEKFSQGSTLYTLGGQFIMMG
ncbi:hypothetical protein GALMADRAFT_276605 [Galerina marginata CBS 339.88]|uniref:DUF6593 domain-containing protein n=1 Tax=Galerina marginata (strain CBS 339.88) TaxID=685588 RepID=A0A067TI28_GALM3|nr:hypothetical protein GALMADRAFT_276605 [Galerina marginata CBS 339.88]